MPGTHPTRATTRQHQQQLQQAAATAHDGPRVSRQHSMGDSSSPSSPTAAAAPPSAEGSAGAAAPVSAATTTGTASAAGIGTAPAVAEAASALTIDPALAPARRPDGQPALAAAGAGPSPPSSSRGDQQRDRGQEEDQDHDRRSQLGPEPQMQPRHLSPAFSTTTPPRRRSFFSRFTLPFRAPARTIADFHIRPAEPHRKYVAGDHVLGAVVLAVVKPVRITHLTVSLRGLVGVFKDPNSAATASLPTDTATESSSTSSRLLASKSSASSSSSYLGNGHALLFRDEMVLSGTGRLEPGNYEFEFDLVFPSHGLPSSIDFERGSICYVVTATLTRPTTVAPIQSCDRRVYLVDPVDIGTVPKPRPRTISLEPISKRSKKRKIVVVTQPPTATGSTAVIPAGAMSTISFASGGESSERGSARDSAHGTMQTEDNEQDAYAEGQSRTSRASHPRSPAPTDIRSEISVDSVTSGGSESRSRSSGIVGAAGGSGSGSGSGPGAGPGSGAGAGSNIIRLSSPASSHAAMSTAGHSAATTTGTNTSSSTITNPAAGSNNGNSTVGNGHRSHNSAPLSSMSTTTIGGAVDDRTITATIDLLKGGCLPGEVVSVKVSVQHVKRIKSLHGVVVTLYRQGRIDSAPPEFMFASAGTSIAEEDEGPSGEGGGSNGILVNGSTLGPQQHPDLDDEQLEPQSRKQKKQKDKEANEKAKQVRDQKKDKERSHKSSKDKKSGGGSRNGSAKHENYYPKSKTGLGGLSLMSADTCSVFRKDLSQSFSPLIIDPRTLQSSVTASVRMPEDAFATIKGVPGEMISFKYQLEVIIDLGGKLAGLLQSGIGPAGPNLVNNSSNPYDGKPMLAPTSALWSGGSHMIDTDQLRRQKGVIFVAFEVVVGTTDTSRQRGRGLKGTALSPDVQQQSDQQQLLLQQQQQQQQPPLPYVSHHPPDWYPEDRKGPYPQPRQPPYPSWPANGMASGSGAAGPSNAPPGPYQQHHPYYQYPQQPDYDNHDFHHHPHHEPNYGYYDDAGSPSTGAPRPPYIDHGHNSQAPQYVPTAEMLAVEHNANLSEKERIRRAEQRLLPSQPGDPSQPGPGQSAVAEPVDSGEVGSSANRHVPTAPTAPSLDELTAFSNRSSAPPFDADSGPGPAQPPSEDKQELERRRLLAEASAPPDFPDDYEDAGPSSSSRGGQATRAYAAGPSCSAGAGMSSFNDGSGAVASPSAPSAPALEEEDGHHQQYNQTPAYRHPPAASSSSLLSAPAAGPPAPPALALAPSAPPAEALLGGDIASPTVAAGAATAPLAGDVDPAAEGTTDEDRYGRHYTYGPGTSPEAAHGSSAAGEHAEPLPRYER